MKKRRSLTRQITLIVSCLLALTIVVCWILNSTLLESYYIMKKKAGMIESFQTISGASGDGTLSSSDFDVTFENICERGNIRMVVLTTTGRVIRSSSNDLSLLRDEMFDSLFDSNWGELMEDKENYQLLKKVDKRLNSEYLILIGVLDSGDLVFMRTALESIRESAMISNRFLLIIGLITIGVSVLLGALVSRHITAPILQLVDISRRMVDLDFNAKYQRLPWHKVSPENLKEILRSRRASWEEQSQVEGNEIDLLGDHINRLSEHLEETISELKSANVELQKDIEKKTQVDEMRREFLSNVSHELKTPLALIQGYAEGLQECINDDPESRDFYCEVIVDEAEKMNGMVKKLLTLNQLEFGNEQVVMERFDVTELIEGVVHSTGILMEQNGITVEMDLLPECFVWGDEFRVEEVITNYLSNAIHHAAGEKKIHIFYTKKEDLLRISVFNTGQPIPAEDLENIWVKFYKVDKARTREYGGSGIGLSIVKAVMDSLGQKCGVINHEDGVEFWLELEMK